MPDAATLGVLQDVVYIALLAALIGAAVYGVMRSMVPVAVLSHGGRRLSGPYGWQDALVAILLAILLAGGVFTSAGVESGGPAAKAAETVSDAAQLAGVASAVIKVLMLVGLIVGFLRVIRERDPAELFGLRRMSAKKAFIKALIWIVPAVFAVMAVSALSTALLNGVWPDLGPQSSVELLQTTKSPLVKMAMGIMAVLVAPLAEEIMFRGFLFGVLKRYTDTYFAGLVSAILFAAVHVHVGFFLPLFALGVIFVIAYETTGCLLVSIFMHALFNGGQVVVMLLVGDKG